MGRHLIGTVIHQLLHDVLRHVGVDIGERRYWNVLMLRVVAAVSIGCLGWSGGLDLELTRQRRSDRSQLLVATK